MFSIVELKEKIKGIKNMSKDDRRVLLIVDSFWGCPENYIKANLASRITKYASCEAWKIAMGYTYTEH